MADPNQAFATDIYERLNLYSVPDRFYVEARDRAGNVVSNVHLEIDRVTNEVMLRNSKESPIPVAQAETTPIYGIIGMIRLVSGNHLIVIKKAELVGTLNGAEIYHITETDIIPYQKSTLHLNERQAWFNRHFLEMVQLVLATGGFYFSASFDLSHSLQWLSESSTPDFRQRSMIERSNPRFVWNRQLCAQFLNNVAIGRFVMPIIHGFVGIRQCVVRGSSFKLMIVSRRCIYRAGVRFYMRGADKNGYVSNFVESEQILEYDKDRKPENRALTAFLQFRGSIPLFWSQRPNLRWQPLPCLKPQDDQRESFISHMRQLKEGYGGQHIIVNLVNTHGREKRVGSELERVATQAALDYVKYVGFDFHRECKSLNWDRLSLLKDMLANDLARNGYESLSYAPRIRTTRYLFRFFYSPLANPTEARFQTGYIRANCMDCLDRTNVVQAMFAKESLRQQLIFLGIIDKTVEDLEALKDFAHIFKNLWADNGDECSKQYAGTGALKTDFTRVGKRTMQGAVQDGVNAVTRYFKNNFADGYRQDAIDLFLGNFQVDPHNLPRRFEKSVFNLNDKGGAIIGAAFSFAMMVLCVLVSENITATLFWFVVFFAFMSFIYINGEDFVNCPKLKQD